LDDVKIYVNGKNQYQLDYCEETGYTKIVKHEDVIHYAFLYAFYSEENLESLLNSPKLETDEDIWYSSVKREEDGSIIVLLVNKDFEGGVSVYEDWRIRERDLNMREVA